MDRAYDLIRFNNPDRLEVVEKVDKKLKSQVASDGHEIDFIHTDRVEDEADEIAKTIKQLRVDWKDVAILIRANRHAEPITRALGRLGISYQFLGPGRLFRQPEILDLISYLKVLYNFEDSVSFYRLLSIDHFGITGRELAEIGNYAKKNNVSLFESAEEIGSEKVTKVTELINKHLDLIRKETAGQILYYFLEETGLLKKLLSPENSEAEKKAKNVSKFFDKLKTYEVDNEDATVPAVVDWLDLSMEMGESPLANDSDWTEVNAVNILTVHSSKGLEFPIVFLVNLVAQRFPTIERREQIPIPDSLVKEVLPVGDYHLEEERRLFYVGMTRAKDRLFFTAADYYGEGKREKKLSPFIYEALGQQSADRVQTTDNGQQLSFLEYKPTVDSSPKTVANIKIDYLSYSQIETFLICPMHYKLKYIYKIPTPPLAAASFGTSIHETLHTFYQELLDSKKASEKLLLNIFEKSWVNQGYKDKVHESKFFEKGKKYLTGFLEKGFDPKSLPRAMEEKFTIPMGKGLKVGGVVDRIDDLGDGKIEIIDYKTGATPLTQREADKNLQLSFYALAAVKIPSSPFARKPGDVKLSLYYFENQEKVSTMRTIADLKKAEEEIFRVRGEIEKSDFKCSNHMFCQTGCEFSMFCAT